MVKGSPKSSHSPQTPVNGATQKGQCYFHHLDEKPEAQRLYS